MASVQSHHDLVVWQRSMDLVVAVYAATKRFPRDEAHRLTDQLLRAVTSVPANIAEGHTRQGPKSFASFLAIAKGSLMESETYLLLARRLGFGDVSEIERIVAEIDEISRMLTVLRRRVLERTTGT